MIASEHPLTHGFESPAQSIERLNTDLEAGLSAEEATLRLEKFGENRLPVRQSPPLWRILLQQFSSPLILVLLVAALVSASIGDLKDATFICFVLLLNAAIGGYQEWKAEKDTRSLQRLVKTTSTVVRDANTTQIDAVGLVPGDIVWLESGNRVPADLRLVTTQGLEVDESLLTGESEPVLKSATARPPDNAVIGDRREMAFAGAVVVRGRGRGVVVATGTSTFI